LIAGLAAATVIEGRFFGMNRIVFRNFNHPEDLQTAGINWPGADTGNSRIQWHWQKNDPADSADSQLRSAGLRRCRHQHAHHLF